MVKRLEFEGHSDDTFGEYVTFGDDYDCCASGAMIVFRVKAGDEGLHVCGQYSGKQWPDSMPGCWVVGVQPLDEDVALPKWPMRFEDGGSGYSPKLVIDAPDDVRIECLNRQA
jgi:hypothetical protein